VHDLRLEPGSLAVSVVKATDVIIEPLRPGVRP
jgi:molybdopterin-binding protein